VDLQIFRSLLSDSGQEVLQIASELDPVESDFLKHYTFLNRLYPVDLARAALEIAILRKEGASKFPFADRMYFTRSALEQASNFEISTYRAMRYSGFDNVIDLGCSIGGDTLALVDKLPTYGVDKDPLRLIMAQANLSATGLNNNAVIIQADLTFPLPVTLPSVSALFFDPSRRMLGRRLFSVHQYHPPLRVVERWLSECPNLGVKISPGVNLDELQTYDAEVEFISLRGGLKEAVLWFGSLKTTRRRATILPGGHTLDSSTEPNTSYNILTTHEGFSRQISRISEPLGYIYEPDPSILRAGFVRILGEQLDAYQLDPDIAYLTSDKLIVTPFARVWRVESWQAFGVKRLRALLRQRGIGNVVVKKRGSPVQPDALIHALRLNPENRSSNPERVLFLTHLRGKPIVIICFP